MVRVIHYRYKCIGCAYCAEVAPEFWKMSEQDGKSDLIGAQTKNEIQQLVTDDLSYAPNKQAADVCPVSCIKVERF